MVLAPVVKSRGVVADAPSGDGAGDRLPVTVRPVGVSGLRDESVLVRGVMSVGASGTSLSLFIDSSCWEVGLEEFLSTAPLGAEVLRARVPVHDGPQQQRRVTPGRARGEV